MISRRYMSLWMSCMVSSMCACSSTPLAAQPDDVVPRTIGHEHASTPTHSSQMHIEPVSSPARTAILDAVQQAQASTIPIATQLAVVQASEVLRGAHRNDVQRLGTFPFSPTSAPDYRAILDAWQNPSGVLSVGTTSRGSLLGAEELPVEGPHHVIIARARPRNTRYGHPTMLAMLRHAAAQVHTTFPGSKLAMGNIAYKKGGDLKWSVSHNSGRDADIAFYVRDVLTDRALDVAPDLITFDDDGISTDLEGYAFDVPRNWALVKGLISHPAQIQYLFVSDGLKAKLLAHAMDIGESAQVIEQAGDVLRQPADALPHNDHFHLRLACDLADRVRGCVDSGPQWTWGNWHEKELTAYTHAMIPALTDPDPALRLQALEYIAAIDSPVGAEFALGIAAYNDLESVREKALKTGISFYTLTGSAIITAQRLIAHPDTSLSDRASLYAMLRRSLDVWTIDFALERLADRTLDEREHAYAARSLAHHMQPELVPILLVQLKKSSSRKVREELAMVLRRIANRSEGTDWGSASDEEVTGALKSWQTWWEKSQTKPREAWLREGFVTQLGIEPEVALTTSAIEPMIEALPKAPDHLTYNINRSLRDLTGKWSSLEQRNSSKLHKMWSTWWSKNRRSFLDKA